jgi:uracil-DNA glycosylase family 4
LSTAGFDPQCRLCPRLAAYLDAGRCEHAGYHCAPVAPFGCDTPRLLIVGLAPGFHGANATGRPFTGDHAGLLLYRTLHEFGWSTAPESRHRDDGLQLVGARITNAVKCVPPGNKPTPAEIRQCNGYLAAELSALASVRVILALGGIAHGAVLRALGLRARDFAFAHAGEHALPGSRTLLDSYHCSRYNTQTRRLTPAMFRQIFERIAVLCGGA